MGTQETEVFTLKPDCPKCTAISITDGRVAQDGAEESFGKMAGRVLRWHLERHAPAA